jgi:hypothetical protein
MRGIVFVVGIYERRSFDVEVGASISCAANGTRWLREWAVDIPDMKPVILVSSTNPPVTLSAHKAHMYR